MRNARRILPQIAAAAALSLSVAVSSALGYHSSDYTPANWSVSLSELLRAIQFYNVGQYCCDPSGEDGYAPGPGDHTCAPHDADYSSQDWKLNLSELLRLIQFYNVGAYHEDPNGEDGFAPGQDTNRPPVATVAMVPQSGDAPLNVSFDATGSSDPDGAIVAWNWDFGDGASGTGAVLSHTYVAPGVYAVVLTVTDDLGATGSATRGLTVTDPAVLPPDPSTVAPPLDPTVATLFADANSFLYAGPNPIQTGVAPGAIDPQRLAVLRGRVRDRAGEPIPGVAVTVLGQPWLGATRTRPDGVFDLAVNGGGLVTVDYRAAGYLPAQRQVDAPWEDFAWAPDVVLVSLDGQVTEVQAAAASEQVARGSLVTDADGARQATLVFPPGAGATMILPGGAEQPLESFRVRATEYTVGPDGELAMPAELPPTSAYTYAVELSVDEALAAGASDVRFDRPVPFYVENYLGFPVGVPVPAGYYDRSRGVWVPSPDGRVVGVVSVTSGLADLDLDGDGAADGPAALAALGVSEGERRELAALYAPGRALWRVPLSHFSVWDLNYARSCRDCPSPKQPPPKDPCPDPEICAESGSIIDCQNQALGEGLPVVGTPFRLGYRSDRLPGSAAARSITLNLTGAPESIPGNLSAVGAGIQVAGQNHEWVFPPEPDQRLAFTWDGLDGYGRPVQGAVTARVRLIYFFHAMYAQPVLSPGFAQYGMAELIGSRALIWGPPQDWRVKLYAARGPFQSLGGWSLDAHHAYDPEARMLHRGDGTLVAATHVGATLRTYAGGGFRRPEPGVPALEASLGNFVLKVAVAPDGRIYVANDMGQGIRIGRDGIVQGSAGDPTEETCLSPDLGDGGFVDDACFLAADVAVTPDGSFYIADRLNARIRRAGTDDLVSTVAGTGPGPADGDGGPASDARLGTPVAVAVGPDGSVYVLGGHRLRKVDPSGTIVTIAGDGTCPDGFTGDGGPAGEARFCAESLGSVAVGRDGSIFLATESSAAVRRITPWGTVERFAGTGDFGDAGDGGPAVDATFYSLGGLAVGRDGSLYVSDYDSGRVRRVWPDGVIRPVAGAGSAAFEEGASPVGTWLQTPFGVAASPDGVVYLTDHSAGPRVLAVREALPGFWEGATHLIPSGGELLAFDGRGRHLTTRDALTGALRLAFAYDEEGRLASLTDGDGNTTTVERAADGTPTALVAPRGQRTELSLDPEGWLASVVNPAGEEVRLGYHPGGLLATLTDPNGNVRRYEYDVIGRLVRDENAAGGFTSLSRNETRAEVSVEVASALGRARTHTVERPIWGGGRYVNTWPDGTSTEQSIGVDGARQVLYPDGTILRTRTSPDPRFGMRGQFTSAVEEQLPSGLTRVVSVGRSATFADPANPGDPFSLETLDEWLVTAPFSGLFSWRSYDAALRTIVDRTPEGRETRSLLDDRGRVTEVQPPGVPSARLRYDGEGRLASVTQGARTWSIAYNAAGQAAALDSPGGSSASFAYDPAGRVTEQTLPDGSAVAFTYDPAGNLTSLTPPDRAAHGFAYDPADRPASYAPPEVAGAGATAYEHDLDGGLTQVTLPDGSTVTISYDPAGRTAAVTSDRGTTSLAYDPAGRVASVSGPGGEGVSYEYDGFLPTGAITTGAVPGYVNWAYDAELRLAAVTAGDFATLGWTTAYSYDGDGLLTQAWPIVYEREPATGWITGTTLDAVSTSQSYDGYGDLAGFSASAGGAPLYAYALTRDVAGRVVGRTETVQGTTTAYGYAYDSAGRLTGVTRNGAEVSAYTYDANGNRLTGPRSETAAHDAQDRLLTYGGASYAFDPVGRLRTKTVGGATTSYEFDATGNLLAVALPGGRRIEYVIDALGRRAGKRVDGTLAEGFLYDGADIVAWLDGTGVVLAHFVRADGSSPEAMIAADGTTYRFVTDHLGSIRLVVDAATGAVAQRIEYDEFGRVLSDTAPGFQPFGFAGGLRDRDTGLTTFGAREYDPETGRWIAKDPILFSGGSTNLYEYVSNDPLNLADPLGLYAECAVKGNRVRITLPIQFRGPGASKQTIARFRKAIEARWTGQFGKYSVTTRVTSGAGNRVLLRRWGGEAFVRGHNRGTWGALHGGGVAAHEAGHLMGLGEAYQDFSNATERISVPLPGYGGFLDPGSTGLNLPNIMADSTFGVPYEEDILQVIRSNCGCRR